MNPVVPGVETHASVSVDDSQVALVKQPLVVRVVNDASHNVLKVDDVVGLVVGVHLTLFRQRDVSHVGGGDGSRRVLSKQTLLGFGSGLFGSLLASFGRKPGVAVFKFVNK